MQWLQSMIITVAAFFGFANEPEPVPTEVVADVPAPAEVDLSTMQMSNNSQKATRGEAATASTAGAPEQQSQEEIYEDSNEIDTMTPTNQPEATTQDIKTALVAGGCFWCVESDLEKTPGVLEAVSGYAGGTTENPTYDNYGAGGHREVVEVTYDANQISFEEILIVTLKTTDPTDDTGTFADRGDKYSAAFYYETNEQKTIINKLIAEVDEQGPYDTPLAIDVEERPTFWPAEEFHQDYYKGTLSKLKYQFYRRASGRDDFIQQHWGDDTSPRLPWQGESEAADAGAPTGAASAALEPGFWTSYQKPSLEVLKERLDPVTFKVTQRDGTERAGTSPLDTIYEPGIYVDILSGEPLFSSRDKFDSGTGWPSFVRPISDTAVTEHDDFSLFSKRVEIRSAVADNHLGHVFPDGPEERGGLRYCMNGVALRFVPEAEMEANGYGEFLSAL